MMARFLLHEGLAFIYFVAFCIAWNQYKGLYGERGILPLSTWITKMSFWKCPSLFVFHVSDRYMKGMAFAGMICSLWALSGYSEQFGLLVSLGTWVLLWVLYQSFVNAGAVFYGFGWEILLLEAGFLGVFLGSNDVEVSLVVIWLFRWLAFRVMLGAGLIKWRGDSAWKDGTAMFYHYETQPLPGPLSRFFHRLPRCVHKSSVLVNHIVELVIPFFLLMPGEIGVIGAWITIGFQLMLIVSGNFSWLNYITIVLCFSCFLGEFSWQTTGQINQGYELMTWTLAVGVAILSWRVICNLFSRHQSMNQSFDPWHLVNTYGAFGAMTKERREIIIEGTYDEHITEQTQFLPYIFRGKPGDVTKRPPLVSPYHYKLDWQMWFAAMSCYQAHPWFVALIERLLDGEREVLALFKSHPFVDRPPTWIRARLFTYHFADKPYFWKRCYIRDYLPPVCKKR